MTNYRKKLLWLYAHKRGSGSGGISVSVSGTTPITLANAIESAIRHMTQYGKLTQSGTPTTANPVDIVCNNGALKWDSVNQRIYADGTPEVLTVSADDVADQTASVDNLLAVGNVRDEQDIITGKVTRRTEAFVYDGTQTVKPTFMSTTGGKDNGAIIVQPRGAEYAGDVVSFEAQEGENIDSLIVTLTPKQEGTGDPSPDNVRPITGTDAVEVVREGKNVLNPILYDGGTYNPSVGAVWNLTVAPDARQFTDNHDGTFTYTTSSTWDYRVLLFPVKQSPDAVYKLSIQGASTGTMGRSVGYLDKDFKVLTKDNTTETSWTYSLTLNQTADPNRAYFYILLTNRSTAVATITITNPSVVIDGDALPYEPFDPLSTTLSVEWGAVGKNQFDIAERVLNQTKANGTATDGYTLNNGVLSISKDVVNYGRVMLSAMPMKAGTYTLSFAWTASGSGRISYSIRNMGADPKVDIVGSTGTTTASVSQTFTLDTDANVAISIQPEGSATGTMSITNIMLNTGSSALPYEPYTRTIYGGTVDAVRGVIELTMKEVDLGSLEWSSWIESGTYIFNAVADGKVETRKSTILCSQYAPNYNVSVWSDLKDCEMTGAANDRVYTRDSRYSNVTAFKSAMQGVQLVYELSTPITLPLSPQTLKALRNNTVWSDAGPVDVLLNDELVELVAKQPLRTAEGDNTVSVVSEVGEVELAVTYKGGSE